MQPAYDVIGTTYRATRSADARIASLIRNALVPYASVLNVGAGTGSYEPTGSHVFAVEPSHTMIAQRAQCAAPAVRGVAEALPFASESVDVVLGILTLHHWSDVARGLAECRRVARERVVLFTWDPNAANFWLVSDYCPQILDHARTIFPSLDTLQQLLGHARIEPVPIPSDCVDGFLGAYWKRPDAYLNAVVRQGMSAFVLIDDVESPITRLEADLASGAWHRRNHALMSLDELDLGYRLVIADRS